MYSCLIADDQLIERDTIEMYLKKIKNIEIVATCADGLEAADILNKRPVDIVVSDIDMPGLDGLSLLKILKKPPVFIFISSHSEFAVESFNLDVIDYIVKPASFERVFKGISKAIEYLHLKDKIPVLGKDEFINTEKDKNDEKFIFIKDIQGFTKIQIDDILYFESMGDFSKIHTSTNKKYVVLVSLKNIENQLSRLIFRRVHKQYIVNLNQILTIGVSEIVLYDQQAVPISGSYKQDLLDTVVKKTLLKR